MTWTTVELITVVFNDVKRGILGTNGKGSRNHTGWQRGYL